MILLGRHSEVVIILGIKYEPLLDPPPPPHVKICEWDPWKNFIAGFGIWVCLYSGG